MGWESFQSFLKLLMVGLNCCCSGHKVLELCCLVREIGLAFVANNLGNAEELEKW